MIGLDWLPMIGERAADSTVRVLYGTLRIEVSRIIEPGEGSC